MVRGSATWLFTKDVAAIRKEIKTINESYFGAYGRFAIHREMLSDQVRMDAYKGAILNNPSLFNRAVVMDVGCGTGILSLFAAQAGVAKVIPVEASEKIASIAHQVAKANNTLKEESENAKNQNSCGVITVVQGMIENIDKCMPTESQSVDVIVSEWMG
jgi:protein arginine N-methyltransferase 3